MSGGFIFWGLFVVFGLTVVAYVFWMLWVERRDS
jgi:cbb3-type cytochrome oxidase subunit 3